MFLKSIYHGIHCIHGAIDVFDEHRAVIVIVVVIDDTLFVGDVADYHAYTCRLGVKGCNHR